MINRLLLVLAALSLAGCDTQPGPVDSARTGPFFNPRNYVGDPRLPSSIQRVVLLPVHGGDVAPAEATEALDEVFATALQRQMRFEVVTLSREECEKSYGVPDLGSTDALPHDLLLELSRKYAVDGVLFVDLTAYHAYPPLTIGVRAKLASIDGSRLVWAFDQVFSATNPAVANSARRYYLFSEGGPTPYDPTAGTLDSPTRFGAYVANAVFRTLPTR